jgi:hypothetical protein
MFFSVDHALDLWAVGFLGTALVIQGATPRWFAGTTGWSFAGPWQREIAIFDLTLGIIVIVVRRSGGALGHSLVWALILMSAMLGANHLEGAVRSGGRPGNWAGVGANAIAITYALGALLWGMPGAS